MNRHVYLLSFFLVLAFEVSAQDGYIVRNDTLISGINVMMGMGQARFRSVTVIQNKVLQVYTPDVVTEFSTGKRVYVAKKLPSEAGNELVFMEQIISKNKTKIYYYADENGNYYYLDNGDGRLEQLTDENNLFREFLDREYGDCPEIERLRGYDIKIKRNSLIRANKIHADCNPNIFTRFRFGVMAGAGLSILSADEIPASATDFHLFIGAFADIPVYRGFGFHPEIYYMKDAVVMSEDAGNRYTDATFNRQSIVVPLFIRYSFINMKGRMIPYVQGGPVVNWGLKKDIESRITNYIGDYTVIHGEPVSKKNYLYTGLAVGGGIEYKLKQQAFFIYGPALFFLHG